MTSVKASKVCTCGTREVPGDGGGAEVVAPGQADPGHLDAVPPLVFAINVHHNLEQRKERHQGQATRAGARQLTPPAGPEQRLTVKCLLT